MKSVTCKIYCKRGQCNLKTDFRRKWEYFENKLQEIFGNQKIYGKLFNLYACISKNISIIQTNALGENNKLNFALKKSMFEIYQKTSNFI